MFFKTVITVSIIYILHFFNHKNVSADEKMKSDEETCFDTEHNLLSQGSFKDILIKSDGFIDKTLLVKEFYEKSEYVSIITRPRLWGKTMNLDIIRTFFEASLNKSGIPIPKEKNKNKKYFLGGEFKYRKGNQTFNKTLKPLQIAKHEKFMTKYQGNFPLIYFDLKKLKGKNYEEIKKSLTALIAKQYTKYKTMYPYFEHHEERTEIEKYMAMNVSKSKLKKGLRLLTNLLVVFFQERVMVLIDGFDVPYSLAYKMSQNKLPKFEQKVEKLFNSFYFHTFYGNPFIVKGIMTGIIPIKEKKILPKVDKVKHYTIFDNHFSKYFGFTQKEVDYLIKKFPIRSSSEQILSWYKGYFYGNELIYNPFSIIQCLINGNFPDNYWLYTYTIHPIGKLIDEIRADLPDLVGWKYKEINIIKSFDFSDMKNPHPYSYLLYNGYFNGYTKFEKNDVYLLSIANNETWCIFKERLEYWLLDVGLRAQGSNVSVVPKKYFISK